MKKNIISLLNSDTKVLIWGKEDGHEVYDSLMNQHFYSKTYQHLHYSSEFREVPLYYFKNNKDYSVDYTKQAVAHTILDEGVYPDYMVQYMVKIIDLSITNVTYNKVIQRKWFKQLDEAVMFVKEKSIISLSKHEVCRLRRGDVYEDYVNPSCSYSYQIIPYIVEIDKTLSDKGRFYEKVDGYKDELAYDNLLKISNGHYNIHTRVLLTLQHGDGYIVVKDRTLLNDIIDWYNKKYTGTSRLMTNIMFNEVTDIKYLYILDKNGDNMGTYRVSDQTDDCIKNINNYHTVGLSINMDVEEFGHTLESHNTVASDYDTILDWMCHIIEEKGDIDEEMLDLEMDKFHIVSLPEINMTISYLIRPIVFNKDDICGKGIQPLSSKIILGD